MGLKSCNIYRVALAAIVLVGIFAFTALSNWGDDLDGSHRSLQAAGAAKQSSGGPKQQFPEKFEWEAKFVSSLAVIGFVLMAAEIYPAEWVMFIMTMVCWAADIITPRQATAGFANLGMLTVMALYIVVKGVDKSRILERSSFYIFGTKSSMMGGLLRLTLSQTALSAVFNNTPQVALYIPITRDWARSRGWSPSKFLIPMAHANTFGGLCCMIGTSTNLLVNGLMGARKLRLFGFWEPGYIGIPLAIGACFLCSVLAYYLLPDNKGGMFRLVREKAGSFVSEIKLGDNCSLVGQPVKLAFQSLRLPVDTVVKIRRPVDEKGQVIGHVRNKSKAAAFREGVAIEMSRVWKDTVEDAKHTVQTIKDHKYVRRIKEFWYPGGRDITFQSVAVLNSTTEDAKAEKPPALNPADSTPEGSEAGDDLPTHRDIFPVDENEILLDGDVVFCYTTPRLIEESTLSKGDCPVGLKILDTDPLDLPGYGTELVELIISPTNPFVNKAVNRKQFGAHYECSVLAIRHRGEEEEIQNLDLARVQLKTGDAVLVVAKDQHVDAFRANRDFIVVSTVGKVSKPILLWDYLPAIAFIIMMVMAATEYQTMEFLALIMMAVTVLFHWVDPKTALNEIDWGVVLMIAAALGFSEALTQSGAAGAFGKAIRESHLSPHSALWLIYFFTMMATELLTNNAAAALAFPLAYSTAQQLDVSIYPYAIAVMIAASAGYATPVGYQCNMMVWGPGGYSFMDFVKTGIPLDIYYWIFSCIFIPWIWPF